LQNLYFTSNHGFTGHIFDAVPRTNIILPCEAKKLHRFILLLQ